MFCFDLFFLFCFRVFCMVLVFEEKEKEPANNDKEKQPCFSMFLAPMGGRMLQRNSRTETQKDLS